MDTTDRFGMLCLIRRVLIVLGLLAATTPLFAAGPGPSSAKRPPLPEKGTWFDPDEPGTGFMWDVQRGVVAGTWYGYQSDGQPVWYLLSGRLRAGSDSVAEDHLFVTATLPAESTRPGVVWIMNAEALHFVGGACFDCPYVPGVMPIVAAQFEFEFLSRTRARYRVNSGEWRPLHHFNFGVNAVSLVGASGDVSRLPDLTGQWASQLSNEPTVQPRFVNTGGVWFEDRFVEHGRVVYAVNTYPTEEQAVRVATLTCYVDDVPAEQCVLEYLFDSGGRPLSAPRLFTMNMHEMSVRRIWAEAENGDVWEAFRLGVD